MPVFHAVGTYSRQRLCHESQYVVSQEDTQQLRRTVIVDHEIKTAYTQSVDQKVEHTAYTCQPDIIFCIDKTRISHDRTVIAANIHKNNDYFGFGNNFFLTYPFCFTKIM